MGRYYNEEYLEHGIGHKAHKYIKKIKSKTGKTYYIYANKMNKAIDNSYRKKAVKEAKKLPKGAKKHIDKHGNLSYSYTDKFGRTKIVTNSGKGLIRSSQEFTTPGEAPKKERKHKYVKKVLSKSGKTRYVYAKKKNAGGKKKVSEMLNDAIDNAYRKSAEKEAKKLPKGAKKHIDKHGNLSYSYTDKYGLTKTVTNSGKGLIRSNEVSEYQELTPSRKKTKKKH